MTGTTIPVHDSDLKRFIEGKVAHQHKVRKEINHADFFTEVMNVYEKRVKL